MTIENHLHDWQEVNWKRPNLSGDKAKLLGLPLSRYHRSWIKGQMCALATCDATVVRCDDGQALRLAKEKFDLAKIPSEEQVPAASDGVIVDFGLLPETKDRSFV